jgi:chromosome segregation ATPase
MSEAKNLIEEHESLSEEVSTLKGLLEEASAKIDEVTKVNEEQSEKVTSLESEKASLESELEAQEKLNDELKEQVEQLTQEEDALDKQVAEKLNEIGVDPVSLESEQEEFNAREEWSQISDPIEKTNFYRKHREKILGGNN